MKSGVKPGTRNALTNGANIRRARLVVGELPREMKHVRDEGRAYRRKLEAAVIDERDRITLTEAHVIDTATAATIHAGICRWLLRHRIEKMKTGDIQQCSAAIVKAKKDRDAAVRQLNLDAPPPDPWKVVDAEIIDVQFKRKRDDDE